MKIAFIHNEKKLGTGAHFINDLISVKLRQHGVTVKHFYPTSNLLEGPLHLKGLNNILFFFSLLEHRAEILKCDLIQGTTFTALTFLPYSIPVLSHFGSTNKGFLEAVPKTNKLDLTEREFWNDLKKNKVLKEINLKTRRPLKDIAEIEKVVALAADAVVATSKKVMAELIAMGVAPEKVSVIHNALEDYWFAQPAHPIISKPSLVFLGRLGNDSFNLKLKGLDRLFEWYKEFPNYEKLTVGITTNEKLSLYLNEKLPLHKAVVNVEKSLLPALLGPLNGSILFIPSRYEGFSLSLIEGMSQGLIPIVYSVGVAPEVIQQGVNGYIVEDQSQAKSYTKKLLNDDLLRKSMSEAARETASNFTADNMAQQFIAKYKEVLAKQSPDPNKYSGYISRWLRK